MFTQRSNIRLVFLSADKAQAFWRTHAATQKNIYELKLELEKMRTDVNTRTEEVRAELSSKIEKVRADLLKWTFAFWLTQMAFLAGILFKLLS